LRCGVFDALVGTKAALTQALAADEARKLYLKNADLDPTSDLSPQRRLRELYQAQSQARAGVLDAFRHAGDRASLAHTSTAIVHDLAVGAVQLGATAAAGPVVGAVVGLGLSTAANVAASGVEVAIGTQQHFGKRLTEDAIGATFSAVGGKVGQYAAAAAGRAVPHALAAVTGPLAGGSAATVAGLGRDVAARLSNGEAPLLDITDVQRGVNLLAANTAAWAIGARTDRAAALSHIQKIVLTTGTSAATGAVCASIQSNPIEPEVIAAAAVAVAATGAAAQHLAARGGRVARFAGVRPVGEITPSKNGVLSVADHGEGVTSVHMQNPNILVSGVTWPEVRRELQLVLSSARQVTGIKEIRIASPLFATPRADGKDASLSRLGVRLKAEYNGRDLPVTLTPDREKLGILALDTVAVLFAAARALERGGLKVAFRRLKGLLGKISEKEFTAGFAVQIPEKNVPKDPIP
jgi:hypothetical protein